jgi:carboxyl-terminal processing protease
VSTEGAHEPRRVYRTNGMAMSRLPLVVLMDGETASAAEVVAAALRDHGRAVLVGSHTFGKALVQTVQPLARGAALKLTTARYLTPRGRDISEGGLLPDVPALDLPQTTADEVLTVGLDALVGSRL